MITKEQSIGALNSVLNEATTPNSFFISDRMDSDL